MKVLKMEVGMLGTNCYIAVNEATGHGVVVDPGGDGDRIVAAIKKEGITIDAIFVTHGNSFPILKNFISRRKSCVHTHICRKIAGRLRQHLRIFLTDINSGSGSLTHLVQTHDMVAVTMCDKNRVY